jgi:hypothetical protein
MQNSGSTFCFSLMKQVLVPIMDGGTRKVGLFILLLTDRRECDRLSPSWNQSLP